MTSRVRVVAQFVFAPITCYSHTSRPYHPLDWTTDTTTTRFRHLSHLSWRCIAYSTYLFLCNETQTNYSNPTSVLKILRRAIVVCSRLFYWSFPSFSPFLLSVLFVDNLQMCTPEAVCPFVWLCVQRPSGVQLHRCAFWLSISMSPPFFLFIVQTSFPFPFFIYLIFLITVATSISPSKTPSLNV